MEFFKSAIEFFIANGEIISAFILAILTVLELGVRLTPTKTDDGAVERIGKVIRKILDFLKVPNIKK